MKKLLYTAILFQSMIFSATMAQGNSLHTDRFLYCVEECIYFSANYPDLLQQNRNILYAELVAWNGKVIQQGKYELLNGKGHGSLQIPKECLSGYYYLRTYPASQKSASPYSYTYLQIKILNPHSATIDAGEVAANDSISFSFLNVTDKPALLTLGKLKNSYAANEKIEIEIAGPSDGKQKTFCITIAKASCLNTKQALQIHNRESELPIISSAISNKAPDKIAEADQYSNCSLSGRLRDADGLPLQQREIVLSSVIKPFFYASQVTDANGFYSFELPRMTGEHELYLSPEKGGSDEELLTINKEFSTKPVSLPFKEFSIADSMYEAYTQVAINAQIHSRNNADTDSMEIRHQAFYGKADQVIYPSDYIELKNIEEFFFELVKDVGITLVDGKKQVAIYSKQSFSGAPPLILLDNIPIPNDEALLHISSKRIERIELITESYIIGDRLFGGVLALYSGKNDFAGYKFSEASHFFNYQLLNENKGAVADGRNLLYWNACAKIGPSGNLHLEIDGSNAAGRYGIFIREIEASKGPQAYMYQEFMIK